MYLYAFMYLETWVVYGRPNELLLSAAEAVCAAGSA